MEITDKIDNRRRKKSEQELKRKIAYLLGVRHHGSLKQWSPFAQATNYISDISGDRWTTDTTFEWNKKTAEDIAERLSMKTSDIEERLRVYRVMKQIGEYEPVKQSEEKSGDEQGGMKDRYYSVCKEVVTTRSKQLADFIKVKDDFELELESLDMMVELCHLIEKRGVGPQSVTLSSGVFLGKILDDENDAKREGNVKRVVEGKRKAEVVWAEPRSGIASARMGEMVE